MQHWLDCGRPALIDNKLLRPIEHAVLRGSPLSVECGQAKVFFLEEHNAKNGSRWVLKKFTLGKCPNDRYLADVRKVLPAHPAFSSGRNRSVLSERSITTTNGFYHEARLQAWLPGTVLMPCIDGTDWASLADELREGERELTKSQRLSLCRSLAELVKTLEASECSHRDLSSRNVFVCVNNWEISLIDFDCVFHPSLSMPNTTGCGTEGYIPRFVWQAKTRRSEKTWRKHADRFALAILIIEFLLLDKDSPLTSDGGMFNQVELCSRFGRNLSNIGNRLLPEYPGAFSLFDSAMKSNGFTACPSPEQWVAFCELAQNLRTPSLSRLEGIEPGYFQAVLRQRQAEPPIDVPALLRGSWRRLLRHCCSKMDLITLPDNPWKT